MVYKKQGIKTIGLIFNEGMYYLFYAVKGKKGIYYCTSIDLVSFKDEKVLHTDEECEGGSIVIKNDKIYIIYSTLRNSMIKLVTLNLSGEVEKYPIPLISQKGLSQPKVFHDGNKYYLVAMKARGIIGIFHSTNLLSWEHSFDISSLQKFAPEYPTLQMMGNKWVLFFQSGSNFLYTIGEVDFENKRANFEGQKLALDNLKSPRVNVIGDGRSILLGVIGDKVVMREIWANEGRLLPLPVRENPGKDSISEVIKINNVWKKDIACLEAKDIYLKVKFPRGLKDMFLLDLVDNACKPSYFYISQKSKVAMLSAGDLVDHYVERKITRSTIGLEIDVYIADDVVEVYIPREGLVMTQKLDKKNLQIAKILVSCDTMCEIYCGGE